MMESVIETKASTILQFFNRLSGELHVTFEEGTAAAWLYDLLKPHVARLARSSTPSFFLSLSHAVQKCTGGKGGANVHWSHGTLPFRNASSQIVVTCGAAPCAHYNYPDSCQHRVVQFRNVRECGPTINLLFYSIAGEH